MSDRLYIVPKFVCRTCGEARPGPRAPGEHSCAQCWEEFDAMRDAVLCTEEPSRGTEAPSVFSVLAAELVRAHAREGAAA